MHCVHAQRCQSIPNSCNNCVPKNGAVIKQLYESNPNTNNFNNLDKSTLSHLTYVEEKERLVADRIIKNPLEIDMGGAHTIVSGGENFYFNNLTSDIAYFPVWGGFKDQTILANQGPSGMIPSSSRVYSNELKESEIWGPAKMMGSVPMEFEMETTANMASFIASFIVMEEVLSTDYIWHKCYRDVGSEWILVSEHYITGTSYLPGDVVTCPFRIPNEAYIGETSKFSMCLAHSHYGELTPLLVREANTSMIMGSMISGTMGPKPYLKLGYRTFENIKLENVTSHLYSSSMNFSLDASSTTIILSNVTTGNMVNTYPVNTLTAFTDMMKVRISRQGSDIVIIQDLNLDGIYINGSLVTQMLSTAVNELNALFTNSGSAGNAPVITSSDTINITFGTSVNYELIATNGVGYYFTGLPSGITTKAGNTKVIVGGTTLAVGTYNFTAIVENYYGEDTQAMTLNVVAPGTYINSYSTRFYNYMRLTGPATTSNPLYRMSEMSATPWTMCGWIKGGTATNNIQVIMSFGGTSSYNGEITLRWRGNSSSYRRLQLIYGQSGNSLLIQTPVGSVDSGWTHYIITYNAGITTTSSSVDSFNFYIDGSLVSKSLTIYGDGFDGMIPAEAFEIGNDVSVQGHFLQGGCLDEMALWDSDQSANVAAIYNGGLSHDLALLPLPPTSYWRMGDFATYPTIPDVTGTIPMTMVNMSLANIINDIP